MNFMKVVGAILFTALLFSSCQIGSVVSSVEKAIPEASASPLPQSGVEIEEEVVRGDSIKEMTGEEMNFPFGSLLKAVEENDYAKAIKILESDAKSIDEKNDKGETPLLIAVHSNNIEIATALILAGADINQQDERQDSPYLYAGAEGRTEILTCMLEYAKPDYNITNRYGGNALIPAAEKGHIDAVRLLLEDGREDIDHINDLGYTALLEAVALTDGSERYHEIVDLLLVYGADSSIKDFGGLTALDYAEKNDYAEIALIINRHLAE